MPAILSLIETASTADLWTNRQVIEFLLKAIGAILVPLATGIWLLVKYINSTKMRSLAARMRDAEMAVRDLSEENEIASRKVEELQKIPFAEDAEGVFGAISEELARSHGKIEEIGQLLSSTATRSELEKQHAVELIGQMQSSLTKAQDDVDEHRRALDMNERRVKRALKLEGQLWAAKSTLKVPRFRDLAWRQRPIISVGNLKGGVGKTTITAHLAMAMVSRGYRVLLIDLDLQGSLSTMLLSDAKLAELRDRNALVQNFFSRAITDRKTKLLNYAHPVFDSRIGLVPATDSLGYAELNLTMRWLLQSGQSDTRFLLRKALHAMSINARYDIVLIDCPPLLNISCINALAASDYVLIPVLPSRRVVERVPYLLKRLSDAKFKRYLNPDLKVLGIVANRTWRDKLTADEHGEFHDYMPAACKSVWGQDVKRFGTIIPQRNVEIRDTEHIFELPKEGSVLADCFRSLADEILKEMPSDCIQPARVFDESGRLSEPVGSQGQG